MSAEATLLSVSNFEMAATMESFPDSFAHTIGERRTRRFVDAIDVPKVRVTYFIA